MNSLMKTGKRKRQPLTLAISNAGESVQSKFQFSIPPKLRFDVLGKMKGKTQSVALATVRAKLKVHSSETPHYS